MSCLLGMTSLSQANTDIEEKGVCDRSRRESWSLAVDYSPCEDLCVYTQSSATRLNIQRCPAVFVYHIHTQIQIFDPQHRQCAEFQPGTIMDVVLTTNTLNGTKTNQEQVPEDDILHSRLSHAWTCTDEGLFTRYLGRSCSPRRSLGKASIPDTCGLLVRIHVFLSPSSDMTQSRLLVVVQLPHSRVGRPTESSNLGLDHCTRLVEPFLGNRDNNRTILVSGLCFPF